MRKNHLGLAIAASAILLSACGGNATDESGDAANGTGEVESSGADTTEVEEAAVTPAASDVATEDGTALADFTPDAAAGETVFNQCRACHTVDAGVNRMGPSLAGIIGGGAGTVDGFNYTDANANSGITWSPEKMFQYLENPRRVIPGTRMAYVGLKDGQDRADLIAYLQAN